MTHKTHSLCGRLSTGLLALAIAWTASAQEPEPASPEPAQSEASGTEPETPRRERPKDLVRFGTDVSLGAGESVKDLVVIAGDAEIAGRVAGDAVVILGSLALKETAVIDGDLVVVAGDADVDSGAIVEGEFVVVSGSEMALTHFGLDRGRLDAAKQWITEGLLLGRLIVPDLPLAWIVFAVVAVVFLAINLVFEQGVRSCADAIQSKPITTCIAGILVMLLAGPVTFLLMISLVGLPVVPFLWLSLILAGVFGWVATVRWIGGKLVPESDAGDRLQATISVAIGLGLLCVAYMIPVLGIASHAVTGVIGIGAAATTLVTSLRREHPRSSPPNGVEPAAGAGAAGMPSSVAGQADSVETPVSTALPMAGFFSRAGALALDLILVVVACVLVGLDWGPTFVVFLAYHIALWASISTTVGGIICRVRVVREDQASLEFVDALVRGLGAIFSVVVVGLGWIWMLWDPMRQTWHDRIAGTYVVEVPRGAGMLGRQDLGPS